MKVQLFAVAALCATVNLAEAKPHPSVRRALTFRASNGDYSKSSSSTIETELSKYQTYNPYGNAVFQDQSDRSSSLSASSSSSYSSSSSSSSSSIGGGFPGRHRKRHGPGLPGLPGFPGFPGHGQGLPQKSDYSHSTSSSISSSSSVGSESVEEVFHDKPTFKYKHKYDITNNKKHIIEHYPVVTKTINNHYIKEDVVRHKVYHNQHQYVDKVTPVKGHVIKGKTYAVDHSKSSAPVVSDGNVGNGYGITVGNGYGDSVGNGYGNEVGNGYGNRALPLAGNGIAGNGGLPVAANGGLPGPPSGPASPAGPPLGR